MPLVFLDLPENLKSIQLGHSEIQDDKVGTELFERVERFEAIPRFTDHLKSRQSGEKAAQRLPHFGRIVH